MRRKRCGRACPSMIPLSFHNACRKKSAKRCCRPTTTRRYEIPRKFRTASLTACAPVTWDRPNKPFQNASALRNGSTPLRKHEGRGKSQRSARLHPLQECGRPFLPVSRCNAQLWPQREAALADIATDATIKHPRAFGKARPHRIDVRFRIAYQLCQRPPRCDPPIAWQAGRVGTIRVVTNQIINRHVSAVHTEWFCEQCRESMLSTVGAAAIRSIP